MSFFLATPKSVQKLLYLFFVILLVFSGSAYALDYYLIDNKASSICGFSGNYGGMSSRFGGGGPMPIYNTCKHFGNGPDSARIKQLIFDSMNDSEKRDFLEGNPRLSEYRSRLKPLVSREQYLVFNLSILLLDVIENSYPRPENYCSDARSQSAIQLCNKKWIESGFEESVFFRQVTEIDRALRQADPGDEDGMLRIRALYGALKSDSERMTVEEVHSSLFK